MHTATKIAVVIAIFAFQMAFAQSFLSSILAPQVEEQPPEAPPAATPADPPPVVPSVAPPPVAPPPSAPKTVTYEIFLDAIINLANSVMPERARFDSQVRAINAESPAPRDEYESSAEYERRLAAFEVGKKQKIQAREQEYLAKTKSAIDRIKAGVSSSEDILPDFEGMLEKNTNVDGYKDRINKLSSKTSNMKNKISQASDLLVKLNFPPAEMKALIMHWRDKNILYIQRLQKAQELMKDYIIQEQARVLTTGKSKFNMSLGAYNADAGEFEFSMNDVNSRTVPFDYSGIIKIANSQAREMNRRTDDLTASVDYINYPFIAADGSRLYPGVTKAQVFYKGQEVATRGSFKVIQSLNKTKGFMDWALYADSLMSGKLSSRNLTSAYVTGGDTGGGSQRSAREERRAERREMRAEANAVAPSSNSEAIAFTPNLNANYAEVDNGMSKETSKDEGWTGKTYLRIAAFGLAAVSTVLAIRQSSDVNDKTKIRDEAFEIVNGYSNDPDFGPEGPYSDVYWEAADVYHKSAKDVSSSENLRTGFMAGAGVLGVAGVLTFFF